MCALVFAAHFSSYTFVAPFLLRNAEFNMTSISPILLGFGVLGVVSNFAVSSILTKHLKASLCVMILLLMFALLLLPMLAHSAPAVIALVLAWGFAFGAIPLCLSVWMQQAVPDHAEAGSAMFIAFIQIAIAVGSSTGGAVVDHVGIPADFKLGFAFSVVGLFVLMSMKSNMAGATTSTAPPKSGKLVTRPCVDA
jgi:predicted MFS family arabinose efflux permease